MALQEHGACCLWLCQETRMLSTGPSFENIFNDSSITTVRVPPLNLNALPESASCLYWQQRWQPGLRIHYHHCGMFYERGGKGRKLG